MVNAKKIGNKIAEARKKINLSQAQLAQRLFISSQAVGKWERGESMPDIITLNRLAEILEVDLNYFSDSLETKNVEVSTEDLVKESSELTIKENKKKLSWNMSHGNWVDADFSGLKNLNEKFASSNMQRCMFIGSDMSALLLKNNNVDSCDFSNSNISKSIIHGSNLANNIFKKCLLKETQFSGTYIMGCDFTDADFSEAEFKSGGLQNNIIANSKWNHTSFIGMQIQDMVFDGRLEDCYFENCAFKKVTFQNATLVNTFFKNKSLKGIKFIDCQVDKITYTFLKIGKADLTGINLLAQ
jgi:uncharacterized protein YjbI with pentapeptide repeats